MNFVVVGLVDAPPRPAGMLEAPPGPCLLQRGCHTRCIAPTGSQKRANVMSAASSRNEWVEKRMAPSARARRVGATWLERRARWLASVGLRQGKGRPAAAKR